MSEFKVNIVSSNEEILEAPRLLSAKFAISTVLVIFTYPVKEGAANRPNLISQLHT